MNKEVPVANSNDKTKTPILNGQKDTFDVFYIEDTVYARFVESRIDKNPMCTRIDKLETNARKTHSPCTSDSSTAGVSYHMMCVSRRCPKQNLVHS